MRDVRSAEDLTEDPQVKPTDPPPFIDVPVKTNDPKALKRKQIDDKAKALKDEADLREILATQGGVRFLARLLGELCYLDFTVFHSNSMTMANIAGRRQIGLEIKELIRECDFDLWVKVDREMAGRRANHSPHR
jgi:hypothetical protein